jgi:uncharacterized membrane protein YhfC
MILSIIVLCATNFGYHYFIDRDYNAAFERSYFQAVAILIYSISLEMTK